MEIRAFTSCFGDSAQIVLDLFNKYSEDMVIEVTFNNMDNKIFDNGVFKDEFFSRVLTTFGNFKFKCTHPNVSNDLQIIGEREIEVSKVLFEYGFAKTSYVTPINFVYNPSGIFQNVVYIRKLALVINIGKWEIQKVVRINSSKQNHKSITQKYTVADVINPTIYDHIFYKFRYYGDKSDIIPSFIDTMDTISPSMYRIFNRIWYNINNIISINSIEPVIEYFKPYVHENTEYSAYKLKGDIKTIIEYNNCIYSVEDTFTKIGKCNCSGLRVFKCINDRYISILYNNAPEPITRKEYKSTVIKDEHSVIFKSNSQNELVVGLHDKTINFMYKNGWLYVRGYKNEVICRDSISNQLSPRHFGYSLLEQHKPNEELYILYYLPFNHKPVCRKHIHDGAIKCKLVNNSYEFVEYLESETQVDTYRHALDISLSHFTHSANRIPVKLDNGTKLNQLIYEKYLNSIQSLRMLFSIDEESIHNPQIIKRLCDITAIFAVGKRIVLGQFIKSISNNGIVEIPALIDIRTKVWNKENVDISVLKQLENIFMFTNFTINSINAVIIMQPLDEDKSISFRNIYRNILSNDCLIIVKNNANPEITELFRHIETINAYGSVISVYVLATA